MYKYKYLERRQNLSFVDLCRMQFFSWEVMLCLLSTVRMGMGIAEVGNGKFEEPFTTISIGLMLWFNLIIGIWCNLKTSPYSNISQIQVTFELTVTLQFHSSFVITENVCIVSYIGFFFLLSTISFISQYRILSQKGFKSQWIQYHIIDMTIKFEANFWQTQPQPVNPTRHHCGL